MNDNATVTSADEGASTNMGADNRPSITFEKMERFKEDAIKVVLADRITTFVGPNGAGKSTLLEAIALVLQFVKTGNLQASREELRNRLLRSQNPKTARTTNPSWGRAILELPLQNGQKVPIGLLGGDDKLQPSRVRIVVTFHHKSRNLVIESIDYGAKEAVRFDVNRDTYLTTGKTPDNLTRSLTELNQKKSQLQSNPNNPQRQQDLQTTESQIAHINQQISQATSDADVFLAIENRQAPKADFEKFLRAIPVPPPYLIQSSDEMDRQIEELRKQFMALQREEDSDQDGSGYQDLKKALHEFLHCHVGVGGNDNTFKLFIDKRDVGELSMGTYLGLGFFAVIQQTPRDGVVLWDEPENSLHTTRRMKIRSLMETDSRRYLIATHQTEFAPVFNCDCIVYKMLSRFSLGETARAECTITAANSSSLADAFHINESLGIEPSKVLFTANAVVWVEGPSDAIYWRIWISEFCAKNGIDLVEGFDFTFLFSGGRLLAHVSADGNVNPKTGESFVDVLRVCPASLFIVDSDIDESVGKTLPNWEDGVNKAIADVITKLEPRAQELHRAIEANRKDKGFCGLLVTYGRETENYLPPEVFRSMIASLYRVDVNTDKNELSIINQIDLGRWDSYEKIAIERIEGSTESGTKLHSKKDSKKVGRKKLLEHKPTMAEIYRDMMLSDHPTNAPVKSVIDFILEVKKRYNY